MPKGITLDRVSLLESESLRTALLQAVEDGVPIKTAWIAAGLNRYALWEWMHAAEHGVWRKQPDSPISPESLATIREFVDQVHQARARLEAKLIQRIVDAGAKTNEKTGMLDWRANSWVLNNHPLYRETYHPELNKSLSLELGPRPNRPDLSGLSEAQLIDLAGGEWREILAPRELSDGRTDAD